MQASTSTELNAARYQALRAHDARFDGQFFVGVSSTRVYCRPVCRVKTPRQENCHFFQLAAQAEQAGYRPCLRCRPELAPGLLAWSLHDASSTLALQAAQLLDHFNLWGTDTGWMEALASRLGVTTRHVRRLFAVHWGVSPLQYLQTRRLLCAKQLLTDTALPVGQIAHQSGYASVRSFNAAFQKHYRLNPTQLRRQQTVVMLANKPIRLAYRPPYDVNQLIEFFRLRQISAMEFVIQQGQDPVLVKTLRIMTPKKTHCGWVQMRFKSTVPHVELWVSDGLIDVMPQVIQRVRAFLDLDADPQAIASVLSADFPLAQGLRLPGALDGFELAVRAVLGQQITVAAACTLMTRLLDRLGQPIITPWKTLNRVFPSAADLASVKPSALGELGIFKQRQSALISLALAVASGEVELNLPMNVSATIERLRQIPGIGDWTAQYIAMRALHWPDALPAGDIALQKALGLQDAKSPGAAVSRLATRWQPWRSYAVIGSWAGKYQPS